MKICVTGGAGYVGAQLIPKLIYEGHDVTVLDTFWYGDGRAVFPTIMNSPYLRLIKGDIRDYQDLSKAFRGQDCVIHLACISNDPSFEMNPDLGRQVNYDAFKGIMHALKNHNVKKFIYASSSSVYGVKDTPNVTEDMPCNPLTDYSKYKLMCEELLKSSTWNGEWTILRPATVCGWSPRLRLDLSVNILTIHGLVNKKIIVHGGNQLRPNINIKDMVRAYLAVLNAKPSAVNKQTFNVGFENMSINTIAKTVKKAMMDEKVEIAVEPSNDPRSYHVNSDKIKKAINFEAKESIYRAIDSLILAYSTGKIRNPMNNSAYYNMRKMKELNL